MKGMELMNTEKWLYLIIETKSREFDSKLFLACVAAEKGMNVILGGKRLINLLGLCPKGYFLDKDASASNERKFHNLVSLGHSVIVMDEEGLVLSRTDVYKQMVSEKALSLTKYFLAWGQNHNDVLKQIVNQEHYDKIKITGNPRIDLLKMPVNQIFQEEVKSIQDEYGKIILINTNFGWANHFLGNEIAINRIIANELRMKDEYINQFRTKSEFHKRLLNYFLEMLPRLSTEFPDYTIIVRPHPTEKLEVWEEKTKNLKNVFVNREGNVIAWIKAAKVVIHNNCTTAVESFLLETPVISYRPARSMEFDVELPNSLSYETQNIDELVLSIRKLITGFNDSLFYKKRKAIVNYYIDGNEQDLAAEKIVNLLSEQKNESSTDNVKLRTIFIKIRGKYEDLKVLIEKSIIKNNRDKGYSYQKFPGITQEEIKKRITNLKNYTGRFKDIESEKIMDSCYLIKKNNTIQKKNVKC